MRRIAGTFLAVAAGFLSACAVSPGVAPPTAPAGVTAPTTPRAADDALPPPGAAPFASLAARFTDRALKQERAGDLRLARDSWRVVAGLRPEAQEPANRVKDLTARLKAEAERHFRGGNSRLEEGNIDAARREFLLTLISDPDHAGALEALKDRLEPDATPYTVAGGDTFESIAKMHYGDPAKSPLVARVNNLDPAGKPTPGTTLTLPNLSPPAAKPALKRPPGAAADAPETPDSGYDTEPAAAGTEEAPAAESPATAPTPLPAESAAPSEPVRADPAETQLAKAQELFQAKKFEAAGGAADKLTGNPAVGARARELSGNAWFAAGDTALEQERFADAIAAYRKAEPARKDVPTAIAGVERRKKEKAEEYYNAGVRFFINQNLDKAILSWERTIALNPEHPKAAKDIEKARALQLKLKDLR